MTAADVTLSLQGLAAEAVAPLRARHGFNELASSDRRGLLRTVRGVLTEPMFVLLIAAAGLYLVMGDLGEGLLLCFFALVTVGLVVVQEGRSERALQALRALAAPQVRVLRGGATARIAARELVPGDLFLLDEGERVPADGVARAGDALSLDESLLTGESIPVRKAVLAHGRAAESAGPGGE
ncbi:MAG: cation-transporting P-type ATPase, partial [Betaproteobacteria bacterium]